MVMLDFDFQVEFVKGEFDLCNTPQERIEVFAKFSQSEMYSKEAIVKALNELGINSRFERKGDRPPVVNNAEESQPIEGVQ